MYIYNKLGGAGNLMEQNVNDDNPKFYNEPLISFFFLSVEHFKSLY